MEYNFIKTSKEENIFKLTLARSEKRNAFTPTMVCEIAHALALADEDKSVYLIEIYAEGPVFCAGMDLRAFQDSSQDCLNPQIPTDPNLSLGSVFESLITPSLCIIEGNVYAGGFLIFLGCTYVLAKEEVKFVLPETQIGVFPFQVMASLLRHLPESKVLKLCIDPSAFTFQKAKKWGLVDAVCNDENILSYRNRILSGSPYAISMGIQALKEIENISKDEQHSFLKNRLEKLKKSKDAQIGIEAWKSKTKPKWENE